MSKQPRVPGTLSRGQASVARMLGPLDGKRIPGGCDECAAYQTVEPLEAGVWSMKVHHDDRCPFLARYEGRSA